MIDSAAKSLFGGEKTSQSIKSFRKSSKPKQTEKFPIIHTTKSTNAKPAPNVQSSPKPSLFDDVISSHSEIPLKKSDNKSPQHYSSIIADHTRLDLSNPLRSGSSKLQKPTPTFSHSTGSLFDQVQQEKLRPPNLLLRKSPSRPNNVLNSRKNEVNAQSHSSPNLVSTSIYKTQEPRSLFDSLPKTKINRSSNLQFDSLFTDEDIEEMVQHLQKPQVNEKILSLIQNQMKGRDSNEMLTKRLEDLKFALEIINVIERSKSKETRVSKEFELLVARSLLDSNINSLTDITRKQRDVLDLILNAMQDADSEKNSKLNIERDSLQTLTLPNKETFQHASNNSSLNIELRFLPSGPDRTFSVPVRLNNNLPSPPAPPNQSYLPPTQLQPLSNSGLAMQAPSVLYSAPTTAPAPGRAPAPPPTTAPSPAPPPTSAPSPAPPPVSYSAPAPISLPYVTSSQTSQQTFHNSASFSSDNLHLVSSAFSNNANHIAMPPSKSPQNYVPPNYSFTENVHFQNRQNAGRMPEEMTRNQNSPRVSSPTDMDVIFLAPGQDDGFAQLDTSYEIPSATLPLEPASGNENIAGWQPVLNRNSDFLRTQYSREPSVSQVSIEVLNDTAGEVHHYHYHYHIGSFSNASLDENEQKNQENNMNNKQNSQRFGLSHSLFSSKGKGRSFNANPSIAFQQQFVSPMQQPVSQPIASWRTSDPLSAVNSPSSYASLDFNVPSDPMPPSPPPVVPLVSYSVPSAPLALPPAQPQNVYGPPPAAPTEPPRAYGPPPAAPTEPPMTYGPPREPQKFYGPPPANPVAAPPAPPPNLFFIELPKKKKKKSIFDKFLGKENDKFEKPSHVPVLAYGPFQQQQQQSPRDYARDPIFDETGILRDRIRDNQFAIFQQNQQLTYLNNLKMQMKIQEYQRDQIKKGLMKAVLQDSIGSNYKKLFYKGAAILGAMAVLPFTSFGRQKRDMTVNRVTNFDSYFESLLNATAVKVSKMSSNGISPTLPFADNGLSHQDLRKLMESLPSQEVLHNVDCLQRSFCLTMMPLLHSPLRHTFYTYYTRLFPDINEKPLSISTLLSSLGEDGRGLVIDHSRKPCSAYHCHIPDTEL